MFKCEMVRKILKSLSISKAWRPKVTVIQEAKDLNVLSLDALIRSLKTHEIEPNEGAEESNRRGKSIALKSTQRKSSSSKAMKAVEESEDEDESSDDDDDENDEIAHLAERISKAWIKRKKNKGFVLKKNKKGKAKQNEVICFECKESGHVRSKCSRPKKDLKKKTPKKKAMIATWEDMEEKQEGT